MFKKPILAAVSAVALLSGAADAADFSQSDLNRIVDMARNQEHRFERDFKGKTFAATGLVKTIGSGGWLVSDSQVSLTVAGERVTCWVPKADATRLADLDTGQRVQFSGMIRDTVLGSLQIDNCRLN